MHHVTLDSWSRIPSPLHRLDPRAKILATLGILLSLVLTHTGYGRLFASHFALITGLTLAARLPPGRVILRAAVVLPFSASLALLSLLQGDPARAAGVLGKSYLCAYAVLVLLGTTPLPVLLRGLESLGVPRFFLMIAQFVYRYLFVISEQAQHMLQARRCRSDRVAAAAAGTIGVLFARSYGRAERIHHAMLARGFQGRFLLLDPPALRVVDFLFVAGIAGSLGALHLVLWNL